MSADTRHYTIHSHRETGWKRFGFTSILWLLRGVSHHGNPSPNSFSPAFVRLGQYPSRQESSKTVCCLCCTDGPILTKASTDKSAYVVGETAFVSGTVENNTSRSIIDLTVKFIQVLMGVLP